NPNLRIAIAKVSPEIPPPTMAMFCLPGVIMVNSIFDMSGLVNVTIEKTGTKKPGRPYNSRAYFHHSKFWEDSTKGGLSNNEISHVPLSKYNVHHPASRRVRDRRRPGQSRIPGGRHRCLRAQFLCRLRLLRNRPIAVH